MKILMIQGSPRIKGNTSIMVQNFMQLLTEAYGADCNLITLSAKSITPCLGCRVCFNQSEDKCPGKGDVLSLKEQMEQADAIVVGSPVYVEDVSGTMKIWMDRMAFNCHRPFLMGKPVYVFTTSGEGASKHARTTLKNALTSWGGQVIACDNFSMGAKMDEEEAKKQYAKIIYSRAKTLCTYAQQTKITMLSLIAFRLQKKNRINKGERDGHTTDYQYWESRKWLNHDSIYYRPIRCSYIKRIAASFFAWMIGLFLL